MKQAAIKRTVMCQPSLLCGPCKRVAASGPLAVKSYNAFNGNHVTAEQRPADGLDVRKCASV